MARHERGSETSSTSLHHKERGLGITEDCRIYEAPDWRAVRPRAISVAVIDRYLFTRECITKSLQALRSDFDIESYATTDNCLQNTRSPDIILYYSHGGVINQGDNQRQHECLDILQKIAPVVILSAVDCPEAILAAFEIGVRGYIPIASTSVDLAIEIVRLVRAGGTFIPQSGLFRRSNNRPEADVRKLPTHSFTSRQIEVLNRLKLGKPNKIIAHELGVSESTVKGDIHRMMKKMKATNRTEVACRAYGFATDLASLPPRFCAG
jgi:DNA-binding NarL/FixJ family response regulator